MSTAPFLDPVRRLRCIGLPRSQECQAGLSARLLCRGTGTGRSSRWSALSSTSSRRARSALRLTAHACAKELVRRAATPRTSRRLAAASHGWTKPGTGPGAAPATTSSSSGRIARKTRGCLASTSRPGTPRQATAPFTFTFSTLYFGTAEALSAVNPFNWSWGTPINGCALLASL
jgi:hypothetical protein